MTTLKYLPNLSELDFCKHKIQQNKAKKDFKEGNPFFTIIGHL